LIPQNPACLGRISVHNKKQGNFTKDGKEFSTGGHPWSRIEALVSHDVDMSALSS
jgi:hypothetical protein